MKGTCEFIHMEKRILKKENEVRRSTMLDEYGDKEGQRRETTKTLKRTRESWRVHVAW